MRAEPGDSRLLLVTGLSGAGKSVVLNALEDFGFYCIDNLPIGLLADLVRQTRSGAAGLPPRVAFGIDARNPQPLLAQLPQTIDALRADGLPLEVVFLDADGDALTARFSETRRRHPLSSATTGLAEAIAQERPLLAPLAGRANLRLDTSRSSVHELREQVRERIAGRPANSLSLQLLSFAYKHGVPRDADFVFDTRCLPNPHWEPGLRPLCGRDAPVAAFLESQPAVRRMLEDLGALLDRWVPCFETENRSYLCIACGCTGGRHRSVFIVERLAERLRGGGRAALVRHRDL
jgi:UPF0042 nucleotide-binding protein